MNLHDIPAPELTLGAAAAAGWYALQFHSAGLSYLGSAGAGMTAGAILTAAAALKVRGAMRTWQRLRGEPVPLPVTSYIMPPWPTSKEISFVIGEQHNLDGSFVEDPRWFRLGPAAIHTGLAVLGVPGTSKTAGFIRPALNQWCAFAADDPDLKAAGFVQDVKAMLAPHVKAALEAAGRADDLIQLGPRHLTYWNPLHQPDVDAKAIGGQLMGVAANMTGNKFEGKQAWIGQGVALLAESCIDIIRLATGYVTFVDVDEFIGDISIAINADANAARGEPREAFDTIKADWTSLLDLREPADMERRRFEHAWKWLAKDFRGADEDSRGVYLGTFTAVSQWFTMPQYAHLYSPRMEDINMPTFEEIIDSGRVCVMDCSFDIYNKLSHGLGIFAKLAFQRAARSRPSRCEANPALNNTRSAMYVVDEFQEFATAGDGDGDDAFFGLCRESKIASLIALQGYASLERKVGRECSKTIFQNLRTKCYLALGDPDDYEQAARLIGKEWTRIESTNIGEQIDGAELSAGTFVGEASNVSESRSLKEEDRYLVEPIRFKDIPAFSCYISGFDGVGAMRPAYVRLKPYFKPRDMPYCEFAPSFREKNVLDTEELSEC